jgi:ribose 5-phosphate isomerase A
MTPPDAASRDAMKKAAAVAAVAELADDMVIGLGTGSTAEHVVEALAVRVAAGLRIAGVPTSERTAALAQRLGITLTSFAEHAVLDLVIDGADEVELGSLNLIKGLGGAALREKIVAAASRRMIVVVDETKLVTRLGAATPIPVEIVAFGHEATLAALTANGATPVLRLANGAPFVTDGGNYIADCAFADLADPAAVQRRLDGLVGVVETGLFLGMASLVIVGTATGIRRLPA